MLVFLVACINVLPGANERKAAMVGRRILISRAATATFFSFAPLRAQRANSYDAGTPRSELLMAIARDSGVESAIETIVPFDPSGGKGAISPALEGRWRYPCPP